MRGGCLPPRSILLVAALSIVVVGGCGNEQAEQELKLAGDSVAAALDAWKRGETAQSLSARSPAIEFHDDDWQSGARLADYQLVKTYHDTDGGPRSAVKLVIEREGRQDTVQVTYQVNTQPKIVIARDPMS